MLTFYAIGLIGLAGILVPVAIHLWSRKDRKPLPFGSIRFVQEATSRSLRKISLTDIPLLLLRILIIAVLVALISDIRLESWREESTINYYIDPIYKDLPQYQGILDSLEETNHAFWLSDGLPEIGTDPGSSSLPLAAFSLTIKPGSIVISPLFISDLPIGWNDLKGITFQQWPLEDQQATIGAIKTQEGAQKLLGNFSERSTSFEFQLAGGSLEPSHTSYYLHVDQRYEEQGKLLKASLEAIESKGAYRLDSTNLDQADWVIWLDDNPPQADRLITWGLQSTELLMREGRNQYTLPKTLDADQAISGTLTLKLYELLSPFSEAIATNDRRQVQLSAFEEKNFNETSAEAKSLQWIWWGLLLGLIMVERILCFR